MKAQRGTRDNLEKYFDLSKPLKIKLQINGEEVYDFTCFGIDSNEKLSDDRYMIFYNQKSSPQNEISYSEIGGGAEFKIKLEKIPDTIQKLVFTGSIDGVGKMGEISACKIFIEQKDRESIFVSFTGADFENEKAVTALEIYRKNGWRFNIIARGFDGGLDALLKFYGGEQVENPQPAPAPKKISLEKKISEGAPKLISLVKPLKVELEKRNLQEVEAKVALVMDISGSMHMSYKDGTVQEIVNKIVPLAVQFDDDGELDFWYYGSTCRRMPSVNLRNYERAVPADWKNLRTDLGGVNNEPAVIKEVIEEYAKIKIPAYVTFITDGGVSRTNEIKNLLISASRLPIFWQFVGVRGSGYGVLEKLDNLEGRYVDNANFFALDDFKTVPNSELYSRLLNEFPIWLKEIKRKGII